jgi:hypothetical protein
LGRQPQDANYIYVPDIQRRVNGAFYGSVLVKPTKAVTVDVYNGSGTPELAGEAEQDRLPAADLPPVTTGSTPVAGIQSVNSVLSAHNRKRPGRPMPNPAPQSSRNSGSSADGVTVPANARYGIPCVY